MKRTFLVAAVVALAQCLPTTSQAQFSQNAIRIGVLNDQSGPWADYSGKGSVIAAQLAADEFGGMIDGKKIEILVGDHQNKPDVGANIARQWFDTKGVNAIADVQGSSMALAVQAVARERGKILLFSGAASSDLTGKACSPTGFLWTEDSYATGGGLARALVQTGATTWFMLTPDYAFGHAIERDTTQQITALGGKVVGKVLFPLMTDDFSSLLLQAQSSEAKIIAIGGGKWQNALKQANEFGIFSKGARMAVLFPQINDVYGLGTKAAQGLLLVEPFYWDLNEHTRAFSKRFFERMKKMPSSIQAGVYSGVLDYLKAIKSTNTDNTEKIAAWLRANPINDMMTKNGQLRSDGRVMRDFYLFRVKTPAESKSPWDLYKLVKTIPAIEAARPLAESECPLVKK